MKSYPLVINEITTLTMVLGGASLARYGDGELNLCVGRPAKAQACDGRLTTRLQDILRDAGACLVGIPNLFSPTPKLAFWSRYAQSAHLLSVRPYVSAFVTRPDSAPWIDTAAYWAQLESLWRGQDVTLVRGSERSLTAADLTGAGVVTEVLAPRQDAWAGYAELLEQIGTPRRALLCLGPTATVLAVDLCARGVHAVDVGHVGMFWRKHLRGEPMRVTDADKVA